MHTAERAAGGQVRAGPASRASLDSVCRHRGHTVGRVRGSLSSLKQCARSSLQGLHNFSFSSGAFIQPRNFRASIFP